MTETFIPVGLMSHAAYNEAKLATIVVNEHVGGGALAIIGAVGNHRVLINLIGEAAWSGATLGRHDDDALLQISGGTVQIDMTSRVSEAQTQAGDLTLTRSGFALRYRSEEPFGDKRLLAAVIAVVPDGPKYTAGSYRRWQVVAQDDERQVVLFRRDRGASK